MPAQKDFSWFVSVRTVAKCYLIVVVGKLFRLRGACKIWSEAICLYATATDWFVLVQKLSWLFLLCIIFNSNLFWSIWSKAIFMATSHRILSDSWWCWPGSTLKQTIVVYSKSMDKHTSNILLFHFFLFRSISWLHSNNVDVMKAYKSNGKIMHLVNDDFSVYQI